MEHPFLDPSFTPQWSQLTPEHVVPDMNAALSAAEGHIQAIIDQATDEQSYASTFAALESAMESVTRPFGKVMHLNSVMNSPELREAIQEVMPPVSGFLASVPLNGELWSVLKTTAGSLDRGSLHPAQSRFIDETLADFRESGADLAPEQKDELRGIEMQLAEKTQAFGNNVLDSTNAYQKIVTDQSELSGLPESAREAAMQSAAEKGIGTDAEPAWRFTLQQPSQMPVMRYADSDSLRKEILEATLDIGRAGEWDNTELIWEILALRQRKAQLLGKDCFADVVTERRMVGSGPKALHFVENLNKRIRDAFQSEISELAEFRALQAGEGVRALEQWEEGYWAEKLRQARFDFDEEELRPWFSITRVIRGLFQMAERLFGIRIAELEGDSRPDVWHPEVKVYEIHDVESGQHLGTFYVDWHPRESKRAGAWFNYLSTGNREPGTVPEPHLGLICGNLTAPVGDKPALLTHREVETIFHEFGHLLHHLLGSVAVKSLNGVNVAWDFVELPSQLMENWTWERESLDLFARHYETDEVIPEDLLKRMQASRTFGAARGFMRQLWLGRIDLELHVNYPRIDSRDLDAVVSEAVRDYRADYPTEYPSIVRLFQHLFAGPTGYAAGYYSYKWAEVLEADVFTRFRRDGLLSSSVGREYREKILSRGNSAPADQLFRDFMGRDPDPEALLVREGLA